MVAMSRARAPSGALSGTEKVAVLLLALGKTRAARLLKKFDPEELKLLTRSAADLRPVRMSDLETLVEEFAQTFSNGVGFAGTVTEVKNLLSGVMTEEQFAQVMAEAPTREEPVWERISALNADTLRSYLGKEHPQTVAFILSRIDSGLAAKVISTFAADVRNGLISAAERQPGYPRLPAAARQHDDQRTERGDAAESRLVDRDIDAPRVDCRTGSSRTTGRS